MQNSPPLPPLWNTRGRDLHAVGAPYDDGRITRGLGAFVRTGCDKMSERFVVQIKPLFSKYSMIWTAAC